MFFHLTAKLGSGDDFLAQIAAFVKIYGRLFVKVQYLWQKLSGRCVGDPGKTRPDERIIEIVRKVVQCISMVGVSVQMVVVEESPSIADFDLNRFAEWTEFAL